AWSTPITTAAPNATRPTPSEMSATRYFARIESTLVQSGAHPPWVLGRASAFSSLFPDRPNAAKLPMPATPRPPSAHTVQGMLVAVPVVDPVDSTGSGVSLGVAGAAASDLS